QEQLRRADEFLPWAKVIVRNVSFRHRRRLLRDRHVFDDSLVEQLLLEEEQEETDASREYNALMHCLNQLPDQRRELILAPYRGPGAVKELAAQTSRSANSFYKVLQRLRAKLLTCVETELHKEARI
ncbi:MAG: RNA polymerase factor sigma-70, partial [Verrucomicrobiota bacterium]